MRIETKRCPVCRGAGTKGHGIWQILSDCFACAGTGKVECHQRRPERHVELEWHRELARANRTPGEGTFYAVPTGVECVVPGEPS